MRVFSKKRRNDLILILVAAAVALVWLLLRFGGQEAGREVQVIRDGTVVAQYDLGVDQTIRLENGQGGYNILVITEGYADITEASCPDKVCVEQRAISRAGEAITCLPNKTVISIVGDSGVDVVA